MANYEPVIGLEVHAQLSTKSKIFCTCSTEFGASPNSHGCPVCLGMPGSLPVLNKRVVEYALKAALATHCSIPAQNIFARKNYFYPDLPKGYQISQYESPLAEHGHIDIVDNGETRRIGITRIHLEEDAGKLIHDQDPTDSLFDVNRCGTPLIEIVSEPDIRTLRQAFLYLTKLKQILQYLEVSDCNMEEGSLRCDANVSVRPKGQKEFGTKTELKNMNSFHNVEKALEAEIERQIDLLGNGEAVVQQTLLWDVKSDTVAPMRTKEEAHDYRYFPEPDLIPVAISAQWQEEIQKKQPELPDARKARMLSQYRLREYDAEVLTQSKPVADYFEQVTALCSDSRLVSNWVQTEILRLCKEKRCEITGLQVTPQKLGVLLKLVKDGSVNTAAAKEVLNEMETSDKDPQTIIKDKGLAQISGEDAIGPLVDEILAGHPQEVQDYRNGKDKLLGYFVGQIMRVTKGTGNPAVINKLLKEKLAKQ